jgi:hypothetical protein
LLDEAMGHLSPTDQDAVLLRLFEQSDRRETAQVLGMSAEAADERVASALEKLCEHLARVGVAVSKAVLASLLVDNAVREAPAGLAASVVAAVMADMLRANRLPKNHLSPGRRDLAVVFALNRRPGSRRRTESKGVAVTAKRRSNRTTWRDRLPQRRQARNRPFPCLPRLGFRPFNRVSLFTDLKSDSWRRRLFP